MYPTLDAARALMEERTRNHRSPRHWRVESQPTNPR